MQENAVEFRHISMEFPGVLANDDVSLDIRKGEVFALVGENGAGKTTLMNILYGIHEPTNGEVYIRGRKVERFSPKTAISMGVGMVHQHFMLVPSFTVAQNIVMSREPRRLGVLFDNKAAEAAAQANLLAQPDRVQRFKILFPRFLVEEIRTEDHRVGGKRRLLQLGRVIESRLHAEGARQRLRPARGKLRHIEVGVHHPIFRLHAEADKQIFENRGGKEICPRASDYDFFHGFLLCFG